MQSAFTVQVAPVSPVLAPVQAPAEQNWFVEHAKQATPRAPQAPVVVPVRQAPLRQHPVQDAEHAAEPPPALPPALLPPPTAEPPAALPPPTANPPPVETKPPPLPVPVPMHAPLTHWKPKLHPTQAAPRLPHADCVLPEAHSPLESQHPVLHVAVEQRWGVVPQA